MVLHIAAIITSCVGITYCGVTRVRACVRVCACVTRVSVCLNKLNSPSHGGHLGGQQIKRPGNVMNCREN